MSKEKTTAEEWKEPTTAEIAAWKEKYNSDCIHLIRIKDEEDLDEKKQPRWKKAYLRNPEIPDLTRAQQSEKAKAGTYFTSIWENCVISFHPDLKAKARLWSGVMLKIKELDFAAEGEIEKL